MSIRQQTSAYVSIRQQHEVVGRGSSSTEGTWSSSELRRRERAYVSMRQHASAYVSICQHTSAYVSRDTWSSSELGSVLTFPGVPSFLSLATPNTTCISRSYVSIREHTSAFLESGYAKTLPAYHALHISSSRPHTLVASGSYTSCVRPHTLVENALYTIS